VKPQKRLGKLEIDLSPPNEAQIQAEAELQKFREAKRRRKAAAQVKTTNDVKPEGVPPAKQPKEASQD